MNEPTHQLESIERLQAEFITLLPKIESTVQVRLRHISCSDRRADLICEAIAMCWKWYLGLSQKGSSPVEFLYSFAALAARAALSGRRLCGCEKARDALSPVCQRMRSFTVSPLPDTSGLVGNVFDEALIDNTQTPVPDQVQFRLDFPRWRASLGERSRILMDAMVEGHRTNELAAVFKVTQARISQVRRELQEGWQAFCGDNDPNENTAERTGIRSRSSAGLITDNRNLNIPNGNPDREGERHDRRIAQDWNARKPARRGRS